MTSHAKSRAKSCESYSKTHANQLKPSCWPNCSCTLHALHAHFPWMTSKYTAQYSHRLWTKTAADENHTHTWNLMTSHAKSCDKSGGVEDHDTFCLLQFSSSLEVAEPKRLRTKITCTHFTCLIIMGWGSLVRRSELHHPMESGGFHEVLTVSNLVKSQWNLVGFMRF